MKTVMNVYLMNHAKMHHMLHVKIIKDHMNVFVMLDTQVMEPTASMLTNVQLEM